MTTTSIPKPTQELLDLAKTKGAKLLSGQQIRLTAEPRSWYIINMGGYLFIGSLLSDGERLPKFFKNRPEYTQSNGNTGEVTGYFQRLF